MAFKTKLAKITAISIFVIFSGNPSQAFAAIEPAVATDVSIDEQNIDVVSKFFIPNGLANLSISSCKNSYRNKLNTTPSDINLEKEIPRIHDVMVDAAFQYCKQKMPLWLEAKQKEVRDYWKSRFDSAQANQLAELFLPVVVALEKQDVSVKEGETTMNAVDRTFQVQQPWERDFNSSLTKFISNPKNKALWDQAAKFHSLTQSELQDPKKGAASVLAEALSEAKRAANDFAKSKGYGPPYP